MSTSIITNFKKTIIGFNLDYNEGNVLVSTESDVVKIEVNDPNSGWIPLFGANNRGEFVSILKCWPYDKRSEQKKTKDINVINLDVDLLLKKRTFNETLKIVKKHRVYSMPNNTYMAQFSDYNGNVLEIVPGQGIKYIKRPKYKVLTNFSPYKMNSEVHPSMGYDRYQKAMKLLEKVKNDFTVSDCFNILREVENKDQVTKISMVFDVNDNTVYWVENRNWNDVQSKRMIKYSEY